MPGQPEPSVAPLPAGSIVQALRDSTDYVLHEVSATRVHASLTVGAAHHQAFGIVHGGVYAFAVEGVASEGACAAVAEDGMIAVGTSNTTDFLRPVSEGRIDVVASVLFRGRTQQLWEVDITRQVDGKLVARGQLRLQNLPRPGNEG